MAVKHMQGNGIIACGGIPVLGVSCIGDRTIAEIPFAPFDYAVAGRAEIGKLHVEGKTAGGIGGRELRHRICINCYMLHLDDRIGLHAIAYYQFDGVGAGVEIGGGRVLDK